jgi:hypothetical protein
MINLIRNSVMLVCLSLIALPASASINFDFNFSGASGGTVANVVGVNQTVFTASSTLGFRDGGAGPVGAISAGDTFRDYTVIRMTQFVDQGGNVLTPLTYGTGPGRTHELTARLVFDGLQITDNDWVVTSVSLFEVIFDFGAGFTGSNYNNLATFTNTPLAGAVETGLLGGASSGDNATTTAPDGSLSLVLQLFDQLHLFDPEGDYFELLTGTGSPLDTAGGIVLQGIVDSVNSATPPQQPLGGLNGGTVIGGNPIAVGGGFADNFAAFGLAGTQAGTGVITSLSDSNGAFDFAFQTRSEGSFFKDIRVPEPTSFLVWTLLGIAASSLTRNRRRVA